MKDRVSRKIILAKNSIYFFPLILLVIFLVLVSFRISGTSAGIYHEKLFGNEKDSSLVFGEPKSIRSDEWLIWTQITVSQAENAYEKINEDIAPGRDLSLHFEIPSADWSLIFRPHNWGFLFLPLEYGFAFKWWFLMYVLIVSVYFLGLRILPEKKLLVSIVAIAFGFSPFILWWYQSPVLGGLAYAILLMLISTRVVSKGKIFNAINNKYLSFGLSTLVFSYFLTAFSFLLYPPFQIALAFVCLMYFVGYSTNRVVNDKISYSVFFKNVSVLLLSAAITLLISIAFINQRADTIDSLNSAGYPGVRVESSGDQDILTVMDSFLMPLLQGDSRSQEYYVNRSEASNFILLFPYLIIPGVFIVAHEYRRKKKVDWLFASMFFAGLFFLARLYIPFGDTLYGLILFDKVPNGRLLIGIGLVSLIFSLLTWSKLSDIHKDYPVKLKLVGSVYALFCFLVMLYIGHITQGRYPEFIVNYYEVMILASIFSIILFLFFNKSKYWVFALLAFTLFSSYRVMPLYSGLGEMTNGRLVNAIKDNSDENGTWATVGDIYFEHYPILAGKKSISGVQLYPNTELWQKIYGDEYEHVYNRKGHAVFMPRNTGSELTLEQKNLFYVDFYCKSPIIEEVDYVLSTISLDYSCLKEANKVSYPSHTFTIYSVNN